MIMRLPASPPACRRGRAGGHDFGPATFGWTERDGKRILREIRYFAGYQKISSTERYRQTGLEELKTAIMKYHQLG